MALLGWLIWTFTEYSLHRTLFHWKPDTAWGPRMHFLLHGVHHQWVRDRFRLVMPPAVSLLLGVLFGMCFRLTLGPVWGWAMFSGFLWGYMVYDVTHYATHHLKFRHPWFLSLKKHHMLTITHISICTTTHHLRLLGLFAVECLYLFLIFETAHDAALPQ